MNHRQKPSPNPPTPVLLNCDLGEHEPHHLARQVLRLVDAVNLACGTHAGSLTTLNKLLPITRSAIVRIGAHPGPDDRASGGRKPIHPGISRFETLIAQQIALVDLLAGKAGAQIQHVKLHGAFYHLTETSPKHREAYLRLIQTNWPHLQVFALANGQVVRDAARLRLQVCPEGFLDRAYLTPHELVPRSNPGALLTPPQTVNRLKEWIRSGNFRDVDGQEFPMTCTTLCIHGDTPGALPMIRAAQRWLRHQPAPAR